MLLGRGCNCLCLSVREKLESIIQKMRITGPHYSGWKASVFARTLVLITALHWYKTAMMEVELFVMPEYVHRNTVSALFCTTIRCAARHLISSLIVDWRRSAQAQHKADWRTLFWLATAALDLQVTLSIGYAWLLVRQNLQVTQHILRWIPRRTRIPWPVGFCHPGRCICGRVPQFESL